MTFAEIIEATKPVRGDGTPVPSTTPKGWVHLSEAMARLAACAFKAPWSDMPEVYAETLRLFASDELSAEDGGDFRRNLVSVFCRVAFEGNLQTGWQRINGLAPVEPIVPDWWDLDNPLAPFRSWGFDEANPENPTPHTWIWVEQKSLDRQIRSASGWGETKLFSEPGQLIPVWDALDLLKPFLRDSDRPASVLEAPDGGQELKALCECGKVGSVAGYMVRSIKADARGLNGVDCESRNNWPIPADVWAGIALSPLQNWQAGEFISKPNERDTYRLKRVMVDRFALLAHLESIGRLWRAQWRIVGQEEPFAEGFILPEEVSAPSAEVIPFPAKEAPPKTRKERRAREVPDKEWHKALRKLLRDYLKRKKQAEEAGRDLPSRPRDKDLQRTMIEGMGCNLDGVGPSTFNAARLKIEDQEWQKLQPPPT